MAMDQTLWQLAEEPTLEPIMHMAFMLLVIAVAVYFTFRLCRNMGLTSRKSSRLLDDIENALDKSDTTTLVKLANSLPKGSPEVGLKELASAVSDRDSRNIIAATERANSVFHKKAAELRFYVEGLRMLSRFSLIASLIWMTMCLRGILMGISAEIHPSMSVIAASAGDVLADASKLFLVVSVVYALERVWAFRLSECMVRWKLFISALQGGRWPAIEP